MSTFRGEKNLGVRLEREKKLLLLTKRQNENLKDFWRYKRSVWRCREKPPRKLLSRTIK